MRVTNPFHGTVASFRTYGNLEDLLYMAYQARDEKAMRTLARLKKKLCPHKGCQCAGMLREE